MYKYRQTISHNFNLYYTIKDFKLKQLKTKKIYHLLIYDKSQSLCTANLWMRLTYLFKTKSNTWREKTSFNNSIKT